MRIKNSLIVVVIFVVCFGGIFASDALGIWHTESTKTPKKITAGEFKGMSDPADIRGSYTFLDIENAFNVEADLLAKAFNIIRDNPEEIEAKELEEIYTDLEEDKEIGTGSIRFFVALYTGLPYEGAEYLPSTAILVLKEEGKWSDEIQSRTEGYVIPIGGESVVVSDPEVVSDLENQNIDHDESIEVKGKTTFNEVIEWGLSKEEIEEIMGLTIENENLLIRDVCEQNGLSFGEIKINLNNKLNEINP